MREPTRLPVFLRAWRSGSKVCAIIIAILALAGSALAKIGETREQVLRRENGRRQEIVAFCDEQLAGKSALMVDYKDGSTIGHVFGVNGREIVTLFDPNRAVLNEDITTWQGVFPTTWRVLERDGSSVTWISKSNLEMLATRKGIFICDRNKEAEVKAFQAKILSEEPVQVPAAKPAASPEDNDCLIVATQMHARLRGSAHWSRIAAFGVIDGQEKYGHAAVFYQPTSDSNVFMFDKNWGSLDLHTQSHDLNELIIAVNQSKTIQKLNIRAQMPRWIGGEAESEIRRAKTVIEWSGLPDGAQNVTRVYVKKYGVSALLPTDVFPDAKKLSSSDESFLQGKSWSGQTTLTFSSVREPLAKVYAECTREHSPQAPSKTVHYKVLRPTWFVVSGDLGPEADSSLGFYTKGVKKDGFVVLMHFQYKEDDFPFSEEAFTAMSRGFDGH